MLHYYELLPNNPLLEDSSAPSLYPVTWKSQSASAFEVQLRNAYLVPIDLLTGERQGPTEAFERLLAHLGVRLIQRHLVLPLLFANEGQDLGCGSGGWCGGDTWGDVEGNIVLRLELHLNNVRKRVG